MNLYECPTHNQKFGIGSSEECQDCDRILKILNTPKKYLNPKLSKLRMSVYWGRDADAHSQGRVIENLGHRVQHFRSKDQLRDFLKRNHIQEAG